MPPVFYLFDFKILNIVFYKTLCFHNVFFITILAFNVVL